MDGNTEAISRDDAIFRVKIYSFKSGEAPVHLSLTDQLQKCSNSLPLFGQNYEIFF